MSFKLSTLYQTIGVSKQSVYQSRIRQELFDTELEELVKQANELRSDHPGCGVEKMYYTLRPKTMGRDKFCEVFLSLGFGVKRVKNYRRTTFAGHIAYPNLIKGMELYRPSQVIQSDITYFDLHGRFYYLVFIVDVYTREIIGYEVSNHLRKEANLKTLGMALKKIEFPAWGLIHHSDKGSQYGSTAYRNQLSLHKIHISMGETAMENAYAERVNGIIKNEYLYKWVIKDENDLKTKTKKAVSHYNKQRKHRAFGMLYSPVEFKEYSIRLTYNERVKVNIHTKRIATTQQSKSELLNDSTQQEPEAHFCQWI